MTPSVSRAPRRRADDEPLPFSPNTEKAVLGSILLEGALYDDAAAVLATSDFYLASHQRIFEAMAAMHEEQNPIDLITLSGFMSANGFLASVGGRAYLSELTEGLPRRDNIDHYIATIRDYAQRREALRAIETLRLDALDLTTDVSEVLGTAQMKFMELEASRGATSTQSWVKEAAVDVFARIDKVPEEIKTEYIAIGCPTGLSKLDAETTGYRNGEYSVIAAYTGDGKTAFAMQGAVASAERKIKVGVFSLEMRRESLVERLICRFTGIDLKKLRDTRQLSGQEHALIKQARERFDDLHILIDDQPNLAIEQLVSRARIMIRRDKVEQIFVDYLQIVQSRERVDRLERVNKASGQLRLLARTEDVPVIALSQLSRPEKRKKTRPNLFMLKESGQIEQDADLVLMPYRPEEEEDDVRPQSYSGLDEIIIAKQRAGASLVTIPARFSRQTLVYLERKTS